MPTVARRGTRPVDNVDAMIERAKSRVQEATKAPGDLGFKVTTVSGRYFNERRERGYVGIDGSLRGPAIAVITETGDHHVWRLHPKTRGLERLDEIERWAEQVFGNIFQATAGVVSMCIEGYSYGSGQGRELLGEAGGMLKLAWLRTCNRFKAKPPSRAPTPAQLKKVATGSGGNDVKKQQVLLATYKRWGVEFTDDNACDAYVMSWTAMFWATGNTDTQAQAQVVEKLGPFGLTQDDEEDPVLSA